ncbi:PREDICTED: membrane metallo-endopeptidase-like 1 [Myotis brandtii]|uniref:membrane metallo-endopeptidase-like 1 n=1 Tax=Myotis brandtii TaxID=109478 RepID=UPI000704743B|nr:PREDICTED: membrane metallo-endopeptidase-like 1 [Myotis brandtii]
MAISSFMSGTYTTDTALKGDKDREKAPPAGPGPDGAGEWTGQFIHHRPVQIAFTNERLESLGQLAPNFTSNLERSLHEPALPRRVRSEPAADWAAPALSAQMGLPRGRLCSLLAVPPVLIPGERLLSRLMGRVGGRMTETWEEPVESGPSVWTGSSLGLMSGQVPPSTVAAKGCGSIQAPQEEEMCTSPGCVIAGIIEERDSQPLLDILEVVGGWPVAMDDWTDTVREAYLQFMVSVATMLRADVNLPRNSHLVQEDMAHVLKLETHLANGFNWTLFIQSVLTSVKIQLLPDEEVVVYGIPYLQKLESIIDVFSDRTMQNYLVWRLVQDRISSLSQRFKDARAKYRKVLYGKTTNEVRWRECVSYVNSNMESAVGSLYVKKAFSRGSKNAVGELIDKVRAVFVETLGELSWMDEASKKKAQEKAMSMKVQIGYPDYILDERSKYLDKEYSNVRPPSPFREPLSRPGPSSRTSLRTRGLHVTSSLLSWIIGAAVVNAFYSPNRNQIVFPAGILQPPFFSKDQPQALNFGGIGMVIGHEITHGFDDNGRNFDEEGNMLDWWSNFSAQHFQEQAECMVHQYGNFSWDLAEQQQVNGFSTLGENIADNGGVRQAYKVGLGSAWSPQRDRVPPARRV